MTAMTVSTANAMSDRSFLQATGLDWEVELQDLVLASDTVRCDSLAECRAIPARAVVGKDTGAVLATVGMDYTLVQNWQKLDPARAFLQATGGNVVRAGALQGGRRVYVEIDMRMAGEVTRGDVVSYRMVIASSHDGSMALRIQDYLVRLVCTNGMTSMEQGASVSLRHTSNVHDRLAQVTGAIQAGQGRFQAAISQWRALASHRMSVGETREYVKAVFAQPRPQAQLSARPNDNAGERVANRVLELVETGRGSNTYGVRGTAWGAYNAVTEYLTHERGTDADRRQDSLWFGNGAMLNRRALDMAIALTR